MKTPLTLVLAIVVVCVFQTSHASDERREIEKAESKLRATFQNLTVLDFKPSPVKGIYEINIGGRVVYFEPDAEVLIFGEIFSKDGRSLTVESQLLTAGDVVDALPLDKAVIVGPDDGIPIIEFSDPNCIHCRNYHNYVTSVGQPVKRIIFFETRLHPQAREKVVHILCAEDKEAAFMSIYGVQPPTELQQCAEGEATADAHLTISSGAGVDATPSFFLGRTPVRGFRRDAIAQYIAEQARLSASN